MPKGPGVVDTPDVTLAPRPGPTPAGHGPPRAVLALSRAGHARGLAVGRQPPRPLRGGLTQRDELLPELALILGRDDPADEAFWQACLKLLDVDGASIALGHDSPPKLTIAATDPRARSLEQLDDILQEGPAQHAFRSGQGVSAAVGVGGSTPWPLFAASATAILGPARFAAQPLRAGGGVVGVLSVFRAGAEGAAIDLTAVRIVAAAIGPALSDAVLTRPDLDEQWSRRRLIDRAVGLTMASLWIGPDDALALIRAHAFAQGTSLDAVAGDLLAGLVRFDPDTGHTPDL